MSKIKITENTGTRYIPVELMSIGTCFVKAGMLYTKTGPKEVFNFSTKGRVNIGEIKDIPTTSIVDIDIMHKPARGYEY